LMEDLQVSADGDDINLWLTRQPAKTAYWRIWAGRAQTAMEHAKKRHDKMLSRARLDKRAEDKERMKTEMIEWGQLPPAQRNQQPKPQAKTVDDISAEADLDERVEEAWISYMHARDVHLVMEAGFKAVESLRSTLISLAANLRSEMGSYNNKIGRAKDSDFIDIAKERDKILNEVRKTLAEEREQRMAEEKSSQVAINEHELFEVTPVNGDNEIIDGPHAGLVEAMIRNDLTTLSASPDQNNGDDKAKAGSGRQENSPETVKIDKTQETKET